MSQTDSCIFTCAECQVNYSHWLNDLLSNIAEASVEYDEKDIEYINNNDEKEINPESYVILYFRHDNTNIMEVTFAFDGGESYLRIEKNVRVISSILSKDEIRDQNGFRTHLSYDDKESQERLRKTIIDTLQALLYADEKYDAIDIYIDMHDVDLDGGVWDAPYFKKLYKTFIHHQRGRHLRIPAENGLGHYNMHYMTTIRGKYEKWNAYGAEKKADMFSDPRVRDVHRDITTKYLSSQDVKSLREAIGASKEQLPTVISKQDCWTRVINEQYGYKGCPYTSAEYLQTCSKLCGVRWKEWIPTFLQEVFTGYKHTGVYFYNQEKKEIERCVSVSDWERARMNVESWVNNPRNTISLAVQKYRDLPDHPLWGMFKNEVIVTNATNQQIRCFFIATLAPSPSADGSDVDTLD